MGAAGNIFRLKYFLLIIWIALERPSIMKGEPTIIRGTIFPRRMAMTAKVAPKEREPTSPSQMRAGKTLKYRKAINAPSHRLRKREIGVSRELLLRNQKAKREIIKSPQERPSSPSVILKKLAKATIITLLMGIKNRPRLTAPAKGM